MLPPTHKSPPIPTPPDTCKAPELVEVAFVLLSTFTVPVELIFPCTPTLP